MSSLRAVLGITLVLACGTWAGDAAAQSGCAACVPPDPVGGWCDGASAGADGLPGNGDDTPGCILLATAPLTTCGTHQGTTWAFDEGASCGGCNYTFYVTVGGGFDLALRFTSAESLRVSVSETQGACTPLPLSARNECALRQGSSDPLIYCEGCSLAGTLMRKEDAYSDGVVTKEAGSCTTLSPLGPMTLPETTCLPLDLSGYDVSWGRPDPDNDGLLDEDFDGIIDMDTLPCDPCDTTTLPGCPCGTDTLGNRLAFTQDVVVRYRSGLPVPLRGVYRVEVESGSGAWSFVANGNGAPAAAHLISDSCALAEATLPSPLPELTLDRGTPVQVIDATGCPDSVVLRVTTCNEGAAPAAASPFTITSDPPSVLFNGDNSAHPSDPACQGPLAPGECRACDWVVPLPGMPDMSLTVTMDRNFVINECGEAGGGGSCGSGYERFTLLPCGGACSVTARIATSSAIPCLGDIVRLDASTSTAVACVGAVEYQFESPAGSVLPGGAWSASWTLDWLTTLPGPQQVFSRVRCASAASCEQLSTGAPVTVAAAASLAFPGAITVVAEGECALRVRWDPATGAPNLTYDIYRSDVLPVPLDAAHRVASGLVGLSLLDPVGWGTSWAYRVEAHAPCAAPVANGGGDSALTSPVDPIPPAFAGIVNTRDLGRCDVEVSWDESTASDGCSGLASYNVYRDHGVAHAGQTLVAAGVVSSPHVDVVPGNGTWVYVVRAVDAAGNEEQNNVFRQESEGSCTNDFPRDAGLDQDDGIDPPNGDRGHAAPPTDGRRLDPLTSWRRLNHQELVIHWLPSPDEGGLYPVTYAVMRGRLDRLRSSGYTHVMVDAAACGMSAHEYPLSGQLDGNAYYYVIATVSGDNATFGYDSSGREIAASPACE